MHMRQRRCPLVFPARFLATLLALIAPFAATHAAPKVIEESFLLPDPGDSVYFGVADLALDANRVAVVTTPQFTSFNVWIYERTANNRWSAPVLAIHAGSPQFGLRPHVALQGNILALTFQDR